MKNIRHIANSFTRWTVAKATVVLFAAILIFASFNEVSARTKSRSHKAAKTEKTENSFKSPDFAFPRTVIDNAAKEIKSASRTDNHDDLLRAAIQTVIASDIISSEESAKMITFLDSLAGNSPFPYSSVYCLLEARLFKQIYLADRWKYNRRNLPLNHFPENPQEWSSDLFALKISALVERAHALSIHEGSASIDTLLPILTPLRENAVPYSIGSPLISDFLASEANNLLSDFRSDVFTLPFGPVAIGKESISAGIDSLLNKLDLTCINLGSENGFSQGAMSATLRMADRMPFWSKEKTLLSALEATDGMPVSLRLLSPLYSLNRFDSDSYDEEKPTGKFASLLTDKREFYDYARKAVDLFPDTINSGSVKNLIAGMSRPQLRLSSPSQFLSSDSLVFSVKSSNVTNSNILIYKLPAQTNSWENVKRLISKASLVRNIPLRLTGETPFETEISLRSAPIPYGMYMAVPSDNSSADGIPGSVVNSIPLFFSVSDLGYIESINRHSPSESRLYVVSGTNQKPIAGAKVTISESGSGRRISTLTTDKNGSVSLPEGNHAITVQKGEDILSTDAYIYKMRDDSSAHPFINIYSDLSIYHPGDEIQFAAILSLTKERVRKIVPDEKINVTLLDANYTPLDSLQLTTDRFGRAAGRFTLPDNGLLGRYSLRATYKDYSSVSGFSVEDYKAPSFAVEMKKCSDEYAPGDSITLSGSALTYSGMPVAGAKVAYNVRFAGNHFFWRHQAPNASYAGESLTDSNGDFAITLATSALKETPYANGVFSLEVNVTDSAGETVQSAPIRFALGNAFSISLNIPETVYPENDIITLPVSVTDLLGNTVKRTFDYRITSVESNQIVASGSADADIIIENARSLPSGCYKLSAWLFDSEKNPSEQSFTLWRKDDSRPPFPTPLWMPDSKIIAPAKASDVKALIGSGYNDSYLLCQTFDNSRLIDSRWIKNDAEMAALSLPAPAPGSQTYLTVTGGHNLQTITKTLTVVPRADTETLDVETLTFRDKITPGATEKWRFRFKTSEGKKQALPVIAVMSDNALEAIAPLLWEAPGGYINFYMPIGVSTSNLSNGFRLFSLTSAPSFRNIFVQNPEIYTYGYPLYGSQGASGMRMYKSSLMVRGASVTNEMKSEDKATFVALKEQAPDAGEEQTFLTGSVANEETAENGSITADDDTQLRGLEHPLAFFRPMLTTGNDGELEICFEVPDFNTEWNLRLLGYSPKLLSTVKKLKTVSSRPVMSRLNAPRFLRSGDSTLLQATIFNNTDSVALLSGRIEIVNPLSGEVLRSAVFDPESVSAKGSRVINVSFDTPEDMSMIAVRVYGKSGAHTDGEQGIIPVLPSSTPVTESIPIYLGSKIYERSVKLPYYPDNAAVTLQFCSNPAWVCLTALPDITLRRDATATSKVRALYGLAVANGIIANMPEAKQAITEWLANPADSVLMSPLLKNPALKTVSLENTPWVNNASAESLRMLRLGHLLDSKANDAQIKALISELTSLQNSDGGFSWCPGMSSGFWVTEQTMLSLGRLSHAGYLPKDDVLGRIVRRGIDYCDSQLKEIVRKSGKNFPASLASDYLYIRSFYPEIPAGSIKEIEKRTLSYLRKEWRNLSIGEAATAAIILKRAGYDADSRLILESLSQRAVSSPDKGMWFDNVSSGYNGYKALAVTTRALEAFAEITPGSDNVDAIRQWLILSKQVQDWGNSALAADIVNALLTAGSQWLTPNDEVSIMLGSKVYSADHASHLTGEFTITLPPSEASGNTLHISRKGEQPAWGGIVAQMILPSEQVKSASTQDISIEKNLYRVDDQNGATLVTEGEIQPGDKIRVMLTITASRNLDYVALTDERPACLSPVDALSGYTSTDGLFYYREIRNSSTNLFFSFLPKGAWQISYDCFADRAGSYTDGIATIQSQYAPTVTAHSAGGNITISQRD